MPTKDSLEGRFGVGYLVQRFKCAKIAVLVQDGDYGTDVASGAAAELKTRNVPVAPMLFSVRKPDFASVARSTLAAQPDGVYLAGTTADMGSIVAELRKGQVRPTPIVASQGFFDAATITGLGPSAEGLIASSSMPPLSQVPSDRTLISAYTARYGRFTPISAFCYAAAQIAIAAIHRVGAGDRGTLLHALQQPIQSQSIDRAVPVSAQRRSSRTRTSTSTSSRRVLGRTRTRRIRRLS